jgi:hypothetical protein
MGQGLFNCSRGRAVELHRRVNDNDPANSAIILVVLAEAGLESDDVLRDYDTLAAILAASNNEVTNSGYSRIVLSDSGVGAPTIDDTADSVVLTHATQSFGGPNVAAGDSWRKLLYCYDADTTGGSDSDIIPITFHDMLLSGAAIIPAGAPILWSVPDGYYLSRA